MVLDLEELNNLPTGTMNDCRARLATMFPVMLQQRRDSGAAEGGLQRIKKGNLIGHMVAQIALEMQTLAGMVTGFGSTRAHRKKGLCNVIFDYHEEKVGIYVAAAAVRIAQSLVADEPYDPSADLAQMRNLRDCERLDPASREIIHEAVSRGIPWFELDRNSLFQLGYGANQKRIRIATTSPPPRNGAGLERAEAVVSEAEIYDPNGEAAAALLNRLYPAGRAFSIPIISVTGTNGKTTTTRLIAHLFRVNGYTVGHTMTDGICIQDQLLVQGDCAGPQSAEFVLQNPTVNVAVLETARGGLLRAGLGYPYCDVGIVTNVEEDHLGLNWIYTIKQMAKLKAVVPDSVRSDGYAVLNADDELVYRMGNKLKCNIALFSIDEHNPKIRRHAKEGRIAAIYENNYITLCKGEERFRVAAAVDVPLTMGGRAVFMIQNVLPAVIAAYVNGVPIEDIAVALKSFFPSVSQTPGRLNLFEFKDFTLLLDFAHNAAGFKALKHLVERMDGTPKVGIIAGLGDRRRKDNVEIGRIAAEMFDELIIRQDQDLRGRTEQQIVAMVQAGIAQVKPLMPRKIIPAEDDAIAHAIATASKGSLLVVCCGFVPGALELVMKLNKAN